MGLLARASGVRTGLGIKSCGAGRVSGSGVACVDGV